MLAFVAVFSLLLQRYSFWTTFGVLYMGSLMLVAGVAFLQRRPERARQDIRPTRNDDATDIGRASL